MKRKCVMISVFMQVFSIVAVFQPVGTTDRSGINAVPRTTRLLNNRASRTKDPLGCVHDISTANAMRHTTTFTTWGQQVESVGTAKLLGALLC